MTTPYRVLVVEDDKAVARALARVLDHRGMSTVTAHSREEAEAAGGPFDAGVFDIDLPDGNGIALAKTLHARGLVDVVVFHSGESGIATRLSACEVGSFCPKSEGIHVLYKILLDALADRDAGARAVGADGAEPCATPFRSGKRPKLP